MKKLLMVLILALIPFKANAYNTVISYPTMTAWPNPQAGQMWLVSGEGNYYYYNGVTYVLFGGYTGYTPTPTGTIYPTATPTPTYTWTITPTATITNTHFEDVTVKNWPADRTNTPTRTPTPTFTAGFLTATPTATPSPSPVIGNLFTGPVNGPVSIIYTAPTSWNTLLQFMSIDNTGLTQAQSIIVLLTPSGGSATTILGPTGVAPGVTVYPICFPFNMSAGGSLSVQIIAAGTVTPMPCALRGKENG